MNQDETGIDCGGPCPPCMDPVCSDGEERRCWIECVQDFPAGCIHSGLAPLLMGVETCADGQWDPCVISGDTNCEAMADPCTDEDEDLPTIVQCLDGTARESSYSCNGQFGQSCSFSFYDNWPYSDCTEICMGPGDICVNKGEVRPCDVHCDTPDGVVKQGTQDCRDVSCGQLIWGPCLTDNACLNP